MAPYIYGKRNAIHVIDIRETLRGLLLAQKFLARVVMGGTDVLFVGTKRQARDAVKQVAERCGMHYVSERWLGGTLTNFRTIRSRLARLEQLEALTSGAGWETYSKKMQSTLSRELSKIRRNLGGIRNMTRLPGALVVIDVRKEVNALREARSLGIPTVCLIDTDSDPDLVSIPIPGNDDAMRAIHFVLSRLADSVEEARRARPELPPAPEMSDDLAPPPRRRQRRGGGDSRGGDRGEVRGGAAAAQAPGAVPVESASAAEGGPAAG